MKLLLANEIYLKSLADKVFLSLRVYRDDRFIQEGSLLPKREGFSYICDISQFDNQNYTQGPGTISIQNTKNTI